MKTKRIIALLLTLIIVAMSAACSTQVEIMVGDVSQSNSGSTSNGGNSSSGNNPSSGNNSVPVVSTPEVTTAAPSQSDEASSGTTPDSSDNSGNDDADNPGSTGSLSTKEEIVAYYCTAYNKIASESSAVTRTYDYTSNYNNILVVNNNSTLESIASTLMNQFMVETTEASASSVESLPPVGQSSVSISPDIISKAECNDKGTYYEVTIYSTGTDDNYEVDSQVGSGSVGAFGPLLRSEDVSGAVESAGNLIKFEGLHSYYATASVTANIDKATGRITDLYYRTPCILHFDQVTAAFVIKVQNCDIGLLFEQRYTIAY